MRNVIAPAFASSISADITVEGNDRELTYIRNCMIIVAVSIIVLMVCSIVIPYIASAETSNVMFEYIQQDTFRHDRPNSSSLFFQKIASSVFRVLLPFMSIFSLSMIMLSMISSIIYLSLPDFFDEVSEAKIAKREMMQDKSKGNFLQRSRDYVSTEGANSVIKGFLPDFKAYAFYEATKADADGVQTIGTFLKYNAPKYVAITGFCMLINDATMMDLFMTGGELGATVIRKITYEYDYREMLEDWMESGKDYKPMFATNTVEGNNKMKTYEAMYRVLKQYAKTEATLTTEFKNALGVTLVNVIEGNGVNGAKVMGNSVDWTARKFIVKAQYTVSPVSLASDVSQQYSYPLGTFNLQDAGYLQVFIQAADDTQSVVSFYPAKANWGKQDNKVTLNVSGFEALSKEVKFDPGSKVTCTVFFSEVSNADIQNGANFTGAETLDATVSSDGQTISVNLKDASKVSYIKLNGVKVKTGSGKVISVPREPTFVIS